MAVDTARVIDSLNQRYFADYPLEAARKMEEMSPGDVIEAISRQPMKILAPVWQRILPHTAAKLLSALPEQVASELIVELPTPDAARLLAQLEGRERDDLLALLEPDIRQDLESILSYPPDSAGRLMETRIRTFRRDAMVDTTLRNIRDRKLKTGRSLFLVDEEHRLTGKISIADLAVADSKAKLSSLEQPLNAYVLPVDSQREVIAAFETHKVVDLPVVDINGRFLGAVVHNDLAATIQKDATASLQTMVGASKEERALSSPFFTVRMRMPWLQINLVTAFMAAAVVGVFEETIAQVTALAVLLPVVAGQSGNTGAQALAVTMRGLALREITVRQWSKVMRKEVIAGLLNGVAIAVTCGIGVYIWSQSLGLVAVISSAMILAMIAAGFAGAVIPIALTRLGLDPAASSSIILTTVTDIAGFFAFLGIASLLMAYL